MFPGKESNLATVSGFAHAIQSLSGCVLSQTFEWERVFLMNRHIYYEKAFTNGESGYLFIFNQLNHTTHTAVCALIVLPQKPLTAVGLSPTRRPFRLI